ncbi:MFS transporter [Eilatimonas milleporae]|uniref:Transmembrane secretion effector n=1 Tax=Eilatimonas milleporae TaxID=911205 RepID=A0A3M0BZV6_9PROT|nr:MFS transporter [Eilatimonas milleporae]RMB01917.1 transmembrane secretion effector [Eilatimonas milleporae]
MSHETIRPAAWMPSRRAFTGFAGAVGLANTADGIAVLAWAWTASLLTRDPVLIGLLPAALRVPWVLFALPSGILADRADRRRLIVACDLLRTVGYGLAGAAILFSLPLGDPGADGPANRGLYGVLVGLGCLIGCAEVARDNAAQAMLPSIVPPHRLEWANGWLASLETVGNSMLGPAAGAVLIALFLPLPFFAVAAAFLCAALVTASLSGRFRAGGRCRASWRADPGAGVRFVARQPTLRVLVLNTGFWTFFAEMALIALILHVQENLNAGATTYGLILAAGATGGIAVSPLLKRFRAAALAQWMTMASAPLFLLIAFAPDAVAVAGVMFVFHLIGVVWNALSISYRQRVVPDDIRGRVNSVYRLFAWGMMPLGLLASGHIVNWGERYLTRHSALTLPFLVAAFGIALVAILSWKPLGTGFRNPSSDRDG